MGTYSSCPGSILFEVHHIVRDKSVSSKHWEWLCIKESNAKKDLQTRNMADYMYTYFTDKCTPKETFITYFNLLFDAYLYVVIHKKITKF